MGDVAAALTWPLTRPLSQPGGLMYVRASRVRCALFGPVDHEAVKIKHTEIFEEQYQQDKQRWNFDFKNDRPLSPGRYCWEKVKRDPSDADSNGGSATQEEETKSVELEQTKITDFMRKRKSSNLKEDSPTQRPKTRRRSST